MEENLQRKEIDDWVVKVRQPPGDGSHPVILMLHGWTGNEDAMWIFASRLPVDAYLIAPRGLYYTPLGGYGWHPHRDKSWPMIDDFRPATAALLNLLTPDHFPQADFSNLRLVGFSQGAALTYTFALLYPERIKSLAGLSGFLPGGASAIISDHPLQDKPVFIAHGSQDELVNVSRARKSVELLQQAGAQVTYCEDDVGHKLSLSCFRGLESFFARQ